MNVMGLEVLAAKTELIKNLTSRNMFLSCANDNFSNKTFVCSLSTKVENNLENNQQQ